MPEQARLLGAMEDLVRRGRSRGIGMTMITQRPAVLNKNVLTQAEVLVVFQLTAPQDRDAVGEWVRANADVETRDVLDGQLPALGQGDAFLWSPSWLQTFRRVHVRQRWTFDSSKTPAAGKRTEGRPRELAAVDIDALKARIAATIERAKAEDPRALQKQIVKLEADLRDAREAIRLSSFRNDGEEASSWRFRRTSSACAGGGDGALGTCVARDVDEDGG